MFDIHFNCIQLVGYIFLLVYFEYMLYVIIFGPFSTRLQKPHPQQAPLWQDRIDALEM